MGHPNGSTGNAITVTHTFDLAYAGVAGVGRAFTSTTGEPMTATQGIAGDGVTPTIVLRGLNHIHGRVCSAYWGHSTSCTGERVGQAIVPLDAILP